ncbi:MAG: amidase [Anaerolineales bacterium]
MRIQEGQMLGDLIQSSASELADAIVTRTISAEELINAYLSRIEAVNPHVNAVVQIAADSALVRAREADRALAEGNIWGPLHGVPFTVKDVMDSAGIVSAAGLQARAQFVPKNDSVVVARMKAAGGILLGKTNCPPGGAGGVTDNPLYGRTNNPYDLSRTPGGSSGGEAAAIATAMSPLGIGSDSGGSMRVPAHFCGIATLKPTTGRVPNTGVFDHPGGLSDPRTQIGPMARFVRDLILAFPLISGEDGIDSGVVPMPLRKASSATRKSLRVAFYVDDGQVHPTRDVVSAVEAAADALKVAGAIVSEARPICLSDSRSITERYWGMSEASGAEVEKLWLDWDRFRTAMLAFAADYDAILCPVEFESAPLHGEKTNPGFNYTLPFSLCGWPCVVIRAGTSATGLPVGVQVAARPWSENIVLALAQQIENELGGWQAPPLW